MLGHYRRRGLSGFLYAEIQRLRLPTIRHLHHDQVVSGRRQRLQGLRLDGSRDGCYRGPYQRGQLRQIQVGPLLHLLPLLIVYVVQIVFADYRHLVGVVIQDGRDGGRHPAGGWVLVGLLRHGILLERVLDHAEHQVLDAQRGGVLPGLAVVGDRRYGRGDLVVVGRLRLVRRLRGARVVVFLLDRVAVAALNGWALRRAGGIAGVAPFPDGLLAARRAGPALLLVGQGGFPVAETALQVQPLAIGGVEAPDLVRGLVQPLPDHLPVGPQVRQGGFQLAHLVFGPLFHGTEPALDAVEAGGAALGHAAGDAELGEEGIPDVGGQVLEPVGERPESLDASPRVGAGGQRAVRVPRADALAAARVAYPRVGGYLVFAQPVLGGLARRQRSGVQLGAQLGLTYGAVAMASLV